MSGGAIVGRAVEMRVLVGVCERARVEGAQGVHVSGAPGVGKSALLAALRRSLDGWAIASAMADDTETAVPFGVAEQLLRALGHGRDLESGTRGEDAARVGALLLHALEPPLGSVGVVVTIDDGHWADPLSLQAIAFALRRLQRDAVALVIATRTVVPGVVSGALDRLLAAAPLQGLRLEGLDLAGTQALLAELGVAARDRAAIERLRLHTDGNPLHIRALVAELGDRALSSTSLRPLPAPRAYAALVVDRLRGCGAAARAVVEAASVLGQRCTVDALATIAGVADVAAAVDEAVDRHLLELTHEDRLHVAFEHTLVRASVYHQLGLQRRAGLHERAAAASRDRLPALRHLVAASTGVDAELARRLAEAGREEAAAGRWATAAEVLTSAADVADGAEAAERLRLDAIDCILASGDGPLAQARWNELHATSSVPVHAEYVAARLAFASGRVHEARRLALRAARRCPATEVGLAGRIASLLGVAQVDAGRAAAAIRWARRGERLGDGDLTPVPPRGTVVTALGLLGRLEEALRVAASAGDAESSVDAVVARGVVRLWSGAASQACSDLGAAASLRSAWTHGRILALLYLSDAEYRVGRWDDAVTHGELGVSLAEDTEHGWLVGLVHSIASFPLAGRGAWEAAAAHARAARGVAGMHLAAQVWAATAAARIAHAQADHTRVIGAFAPLDRLRDRDGVVGLGAMPWQPLLIDALASVDDAQRAAAELAALEAAVARPGAAPGGVTLARARAVVALALGRRADAEDVLLAGLDAAGRDDSPLDRALAEIALGGMLRRTRQRAAARDLLVAARGRLEALGARPYLERCDREMAALGLTPVRGAQRDRDRLTPQEVSVANLAAAGMSNREIAAELVISVKTVEFHLGNVYAKLAVTSRARLASTWSGRDEALARQTGS